MLAQFTDQETGELFSDEQMEQEVKRLTSDGVFKAKGGTNIEIAVRDITKQMQTLCVKVVACIHDMLTRAALKYENMVFN